MPTNLQWERKSNSSNNFDLILKAPEHLDSPRFLTLLQLIETETHRGLSLSGRASREFGVYRRRRYLLLLSRTTP